MTIFIRLTVIVLICWVFITPAFPMGGKIQKIPMKTYPNIDIPDGEFLHYGYYNGGEKESDYYMVTKKITNEKGKLLYCTYSLERPLSGNIKPAKKYTEWPSYILIDPEQGEIESELNNNNTNSNDPDSSNPYYNIVYTHYQMYTDKGYVEYISRVKNKKELTESRYRVNITPGFPYWDGPSFFYFPARFMDIRSQGTMFLITPEYLKDPMPFSFKYEADETIRTKAGTFHTKKLSVVTGDPFISKLSEPLLKRFATWIEDSDRRLAVKVQIAYGGELVLEEISNVR